MDFLPIRDDLVVDLAASGNNPAARHRFEPAQLQAINAALSARRPLLVRGEPGIGKSQLARAAAKALGRAFLQHVVDARTESHDLLWHFDAVGRLAAAQVEGALQARLQLAEDGVKTEQADAVREAIRQRLAIRYFLHPRALWWAFDHANAAKQVPAAGAEPPPQLDGGRWEKGCVVLIDEIDKAESDVPNGLLEALGAQRFVPPGQTKPVIAKGPPLLVIITTNDRPPDLRPGSVPPQERRNSHGHRRLCAQRTQ
jgi:MoxR-like ATPase